MPIVANEIKMYKSVSVSNTAGSNGGRMSNNEIVDNVNNNIFPDVSQAERTSGLTTFRKVFVKNTNSGNLALINSKVFIENYTPGDDAVYFHTGDQNGLQTALTGSELLFGCGKLDSSISAAATSLTVLLELSSVQPFRNGDVIRVSDRATISGGGNEEFVTVNGAPSLTGSVVTLSFTPAIQNNYAAASTRVANVMNVGDLKTSIASLVATTAGSGDFTNTAEANLYGSNQGTVEDQWTLTFTSATAYTVAGVKTGALAAGSTLATYAPANPANGSPYFSVLTAGFTGTWASGDTLTFTTNPASAGLWAKRVVPAGAAAVSGNKMVFGIDGETA